MSAFADSNHRDFDITCILPDWGVSEREAALRDIARPRGHRVFPRHVRSVLYDTPSHGAVRNVPRQKQVKQNQMGVTQVAGSW